MAPKTAMRLAPVFMAPPIRGVEGVVLGQPGPVQPAGLVGTTAMVVLRAVGTLGQPGPEQPVGAGVGRVSVRKTVEVGELEGVSPHSGQGVLSAGGETGEAGPEGTVTVSVIVLVALVVVVSSLPGHQVVVTLMVSVVTEPTGQLVTLAGHLVMV
jgi:hypothetical protein